MRMAVLKNLSWVALFAGPVIAAGSAEHPQLVIFALTFATSAAITLAVLNGNATKRPAAEPASHVRTIPPPPPRQPDPALKGYLEGGPSRLEDSLRMSLWARERDLIADGVPAKVGVHKHSQLCWDGKRIVCQCGLEGGAA